MIRDDHHLVGIHLDNRKEQAIAVQQLLTEFGNDIKTRLGLHEAGAGNGLIILEMGDEKSVDTLIGKLNALEGVESQRMSFSH